MYCVYVGICATVASNVLRPKSTLYEKYNISNRKCFHYMVTEVKANYEEAIY